MGQGCCPQFKGEGTKAQRGSLSLPWESLREKVGSSAMCIYCFDKIKNEFKIKERKSRTTESRPVFAWEGWAAEGHEGTRGTADYSPSLWRERFCRCVRLSLTGLCTSNGCSLLCFN